MYAALSSDAVRIERAHSQIISANYVALIPVANCCIYGFLLGSPVKPSSSPFLIAMLIQLLPTRPVIAVFLNEIRTLLCYRENAKGDIVQWIQETCLVL